MLKFSIITLTAFVTVLVSTTRYVFKVFNKDISRYLPLFAMAYGIILAVCGYYFTDISFGDTIIDAIFIGLTNASSTSLTADLPSASNSIELYTEIANS